MSLASALALTLTALQGAAGGRVLWRLLPGRHRPAPVAPLVDADDPRWALVGDVRVSVVVPTLNEAQRVGACLAGLAQQGPVLGEVVVVDGGSTDGTQALVAAAGGRDPRVRLLPAPPAPAGWVGKVWQLDHARTHVTGAWILGLDADTDPAPGLVAAVVAASVAHDLDVVSFAPRFGGQSAAERWVQPAMLATLVYRLGAPAVRARSAGDMLANGQCFLVRRATLDAHGGYAPARGYWGDDVALARHLVHRGARGGFLDGSRLYTVRGYRGLADMWRGWGRSFALADETAPGRHALDLATVTLAQGAPLVVLVAIGALVAAHRGPLPSGVRALVVVDLVLLAMRLGVLAATRGSYARRGVPYWCSVLADPAAVARLWLSTLRRATTWRGRRLVLADAAG